MASPVSRSLFESPHTRAAHISRISSFSQSAKLTLSNAVPHHTSHYDRREMHSKCRSKSGVCSIIPAGMLVHIAENATSESSRTIASKSLLGLEALHQNRAAFLANHSASDPHREQVAGKKNLYRIIYSSNNTDNLPGNQLFQEGAEPSDTEDESAREVWANFKKTFDFYYEVFDRNAIDDEGGNLIGSVHFDDDSGETPGYDNAFYNGTGMAFGDGDYSIFGSFTKNLDVAAHELTHGVTDMTAGLPYMYQSGALNESMSDVFGSMVKQYSRKPKQKAEDADWLIGEGLFLIQGARALRDMAHPGTAYNNPQIGKDSQPADMDGYKILPNTRNGDHGGVHINSGIPNRAFYLAATTIGGYSWEVAGKIWYASLIDPELQDANVKNAFKTFADLTCKHASKLPGATGLKALAAVKKAWTDVKVYRPGHDNLTVNGAK